VVHERYLGPGGCRRRGADPSRRPQRVGDRDRVELRIPLIHPDVVEGVTTALEEADPQTVT
jgi:hypothetical protein